MKEQLKDIRFLILDVDGTMTDGGVYLSADGAELKKFHIKDGAGILLAKAGGVTPVILTGRESGCVAKRAEELGIIHVYQNIKDKRTFLSEFMEKHQIEKKEAAYLGDDYNDLGAMALVGVSSCPADAAHAVKEACQIILHTPGGKGAVREFVEQILQAKGKLQDCADYLWNTGKGMR